MLPRLEIIVTTSTDEDGPEPWPVVAPHRDRLIEALRQMGFEVSAEHTMFQSKAKIDVLPRLLIRVHDTVKIWAAELLSRVQEFVGVLSGSLRQDETLSRRQSPAIQQG
jgi:hypothetical protein